MEAIVTKGKAVIPPQQAVARRRRGAVASTAGPEVQVGHGPVKVIPATAEQLFLNISPDQTARLPRYKGDLELINHSAGSITSQAYLKRWNRMNEVLADNAERASVLADWLGARPYPMERLNDAWTLVMGGQFHDIIPGTSIPKAYEYSWNDEVLALNQFAGVLTSATDGVAAVMDTDGKGDRRRRLQRAQHRARGGRRGVDRIPGRHAEGGARGRARRHRRAGAADRGGEGAVRGQRAVGRLCGLRRSAKARARGLRGELSVTESSLENARYRIGLDVERRRRQHLRQEPEEGTAGRAGPPRDQDRQSAQLARLEHGLRGPDAGAAGLRAADRRRSGSSRTARSGWRSRSRARRKGRPSSRRFASSAGDAGNRVEFANAIDWMTQGGAPQGGVPADRLEPEGDLQLGRRHDRADQRTTSASSRWPRISGSTSPTRAAPSA